MFIRELMMMMMMMQTGDAVYPSWQCETFAGL